jgi:hypothetical protein
MRIGIGLCLAARVSDPRRIVAFRNILIHGYADVDYGVVWSIVETDLPVLRHEIEALIGNPSVDRRIGTSRSVADSVRQTPHRRVTRHRA